MTVNWTVIIEIVLFALLSVVVAVLVPWLRQRLGDDKVNAMWRWVCYAVQAAEQLYGAGAGEQKKQYVEDYLISRDVEMTQDVDVMIEAAVRELT